MIGERAQEMHANLNYEYPILAGIAINPTIAGYGKLNADPMPISSVAEKSRAAANLVDKVGFNN